MVWTGLGLVSSDHRLMLHNKWWHRTQSVSVTLIISHLIMLRRAVSEQCPIRSTRQMPSILMAHSSRTVHCNCETRGAQRQQTAARFGRQRSGRPEEHYSNGCWNKSRERAHIMKLLSSSSVCNLRPRCHRVSRPSPSLDPSNAKYDSASM